MDRKTLKAKQDSFADEYFCKTGLIENGDGTPVTLCKLVASCNTIYQPEYGYSPDEPAILVDWLPAGLTHGSWPADGGFPPETGVDSSKVPDRDELVTFPLTYEGVKVCYRRGSQAFAL